MKTDYIIMCGGEGIRLRPFTYIIPKPFLTTNDISPFDYIIKNIDLKTLQEKKLINKKFIKLKILGSGELKKNIEISAHFASKEALSKVEKAGGRINIIKK